MIRVVQCWDDGIEDDIRLCEMLRKHGARASFNLNPGMHGGARSEAWMYRDIKPVRRLSRGELQSVYEGFTIANHTMTHPWPLKVSLETWRNEVVDGRKMLQEWFDQPVEGFVYPYGQRSDATDRVVLEAGHTYARGTTVVSDIEPSGYPPTDPFRLVPDCHFRDSNLLKKYEEAKKAGRPVFYFWGHSYEMVTEQDWAGMEEILRTISKDPNSLWEDLPNLFL